MTTIRLAVLAGAAALCPTLTLAEMAWEVEVEATRTRGAAHSAALNLYPSFDTTLPLSAAWSLGVEVYPEVYLSQAPGGWHLDDPFLGVVLTARGPDIAFGLDTGATWSRNPARFSDTTAILFASGSWGRVDLGDTDGALGDACVTPEVGPLEDLALVSVCPGQLAAGVLRYALPDGDIVGSASLASDAGDRAISVFVGRTTPVAGGDLQWGLAAEHVTGPDTRTASQGGVIWQGQLWTLGLAAAHRARAGRDAWGVQAGATMALRDRLNLTLGLSCGRLAATDGGGMERGAGISAAWVVSDHTTLSGGIARRWLSDGRPQETLAAVSLTLTR